MRRQDALVLEPGSGKPSAAQTVALSLHLSLWGCMFSWLLCSLCGGSIVSVDQLPLLTRGFSALPSSWLASGSHSDPLPTLPLTRFPLLTAEWPNSDSQERHFIGHLWSGVPCPGQLALPRVCHTVHEKVARAMFFKPRITTH